MLKHSGLHSLKIFLTFVLLSFVFIELIRIVATQISLDQMAYMGVRYASTGQYYKEFCLTPETLEYAVKLLQTENIETNTSELRTLRKADCTWHEKPDVDTDVIFKQRRALVSAATYYSTQNVMWKATSNLINPRFLQSTFCSDRPGITYDPVTHTCYPLEDLGNAGPTGGRKVWISLTYTYPLGSSVGLRLLDIPFYVFKEYNVEKFR